MSRVAPDGSPVDLHALLPERGEGDVVARAVPAGTEILELGCGKRGNWLTAVPAPSAPA